MTLRTARIAALWIVAIGLGLLERHEAVVPAPAPSGEPTTAVRAPLLATAEVDVMTISLIDGPYRLTFGRGGPGWVVREPGEARVAHDLLRAFVEALTSAEVLDAIPVEPSLSGFGIDAGRRIEVVAADHSTETVLVGAQTPTGTAAYVRDGSGAVRVIGRNPLVYRDLILNAVRPEPVTTLESGASTGWALTEARRAG